MPPAATRRCVAGGVIGGGAAFALAGIGLEQVVKRSFPQALAIDLDGLGLAAGVNLEAEARAVHQLAGGTAHGFEALEAELQHGGQHFARRFFIAGRLGHHEAAFEIGKPGGHDEIIGSDLDALLADGLDEFEILLGQGQHGNGRQIDLLTAGEIEQQIERAFIAIDIDIHDVFVGWRRRSIEPIGLWARHVSRWPPCKICKQSLAVGLVSVKLCAGRCVVLPRY